MSQFDDIVDAAASRFGLGSKAGALSHELMELMTSSPGGIGGFIEKFQSAGLSREVNSWLGNTEGAALTPSQVDRALGSGTIDAIARKVGLPSATAAGAIGYLTPKLIGRLTPYGEIPSTVSDFTQTSASSAPRASTSPAPYTVATQRTPASPARWILPLLALLAAGGLGWYAFTQHEAPTTVATKTESTSAVPARLAIANNNGVITVSGTVRDQASRSAILDALKSAFGSNSIKGDIAVNPNAAPSPWLANLPNALAQMKTPGVQALFEGNTINLGGSIADSERERILSSLKSLFGATGLAVAGAKSVSATADQMASDVNNKILAALSALGTRFQPTDLLGILNKSVISFPTGSAEIPAASRTLLQQAAASFKQLPAGTVIEIGGHTDNTGDPKANLALSQSRADAVRNALTQSGVNPAMLVAKGYGDANPIASNDTAEGRLQNRRIAYQVNKSATIGSGR
ncbi:MAG: OmpA family protein [Rhizobiales bacterium]|nr:OmpA family protein [Hyphomicrobiales bacterium]